ncbi:MAG: beta-ketoacyl synthase chain length factor [Halothiobacillaceae bacterium]|nr:MAG: beta-ketoacyl synthase chain length factor [Halothiobacillaceae bacterium]
MKAHVAGIGLFAPGLESWATGRASLMHRQDYVAAPLTIAAPAICPPNERRRMTSAIRIALQSALQAVASSGLEASAIPTVFASSEGDLDVIHHLCTALTLPGHPVSPTHFHNSVHNAPAGYWHLGQQSHACSTSLSAGDASVAAGLIEALTMLTIEQCPVLLVAYDAPTPARLHARCPIDAPFGMALLLAPATNAMEAPLIAVRPPVVAASGSSMAHPALEALRQGNPAARSLPLLRALALDQRLSVTLPYLDDAFLPIDIEPCC